MIPSGEQEKNYKYEDLPMQVGVRPLGATLISLSGKSY